MEKLEVELRYSKVNKPKDDYHPAKKFITIGIYETLEEAVIEGNKVLVQLKFRGFEVRSTDQFKVKGNFGCPDRLVSNTCYSDPVTYYAKITNLGTNNLSDVIDEAFKSVEEVKEYKEKNRYE